MSEMRKTLLAAGVGLFVGWAFGETLDLAYIREIEDKTIESDGAWLTLDVAQTFDAWFEGHVPAGYSILEDGDFAKLRAILKDDPRLPYLDWKADFVATVDRDVAAGDLGLYGELPVFAELMGLGDLGWQSFPDTPFEAGCPVFLLDALLGGAMEFTYAEVLGGVVTFNCGLKHLSDSVLGTTFSIELRLTNPDPAASPAYVTIARFSHRFALADEGNWFDAHVSRYERWPDDAMLASGGAWSSGDTALVDAATLRADGALAFNAKDDRLVFTASDAKDLSSEKSVTVVSDMDVVHYQPATLPPVDPGWKGGVLAVNDGGSLSYYGLAKSGAVNAWTKLDGPDVAAEGSVIRLEVTLMKKGTDAFVQYRIGGQLCACNGESDLAIAVQGETIRAVGYGGMGAVRSLYASAEAEIVPVDPTAGVTVQAETAEAAAGKVDLGPTPEVAAVLGTEGVLAYSRLFTKVVRAGSADGEWVVTMELTEEGTNTLASSANEAIREIQGLDGIGSSVTVVPMQVVPGFYYGLAAAEDVGGVKAAEPFEWKLATPSGIDGGLTAEKPSIVRGFFVIKVDTNKETK